MPSRRQFQRASFDVRLGIDYHLLAAMPLDQKHTMTDLASGDAIDREVTEECGGAKIGKSFADFRRLEALRIFDRSFGHKCSGVRLRRGVVARNLRGVRSYIPNKFAGRRSDFGPQLKLVFPLT